MKEFENDAMNVENEINFTCESDLFFHAEPGKSEISTAFSMYPYQANPRSVLFG